ncbi:hypothetical protein DFJ74DRAFT_654406 [Hyaloraphidium curvatum]|nr:hypothetical protein DFJ74DRAFT_654406 [Hyaloraphidium curvatum]
MSFSALPADLLALHLLPPLPLRSLSALSRASRVLRRLCSAEFALRWPALGAALPPDAAFKFCRSLLRAAVAGDHASLAAKLGAARRAGVPWTELGVFLAKTLSTELYTSAPLGTCRSGGVSICLVRALGDLRGAMPGERPADVARVVRGSLPDDSRCAALLLTSFLRGSGDGEAVKREAGAIMWAAGFGDAAAWGGIMMMDPSFRRGWEEERDAEMRAASGAEAIGHGAPLQRSRSL